MAKSGEAQMVDVAAKPSSAREAEAHATVKMLPETLRLIRDNAAKKGDVLGVARVAGIMAAKKTADLIPLCHSIPLDDVTVSFQIETETSTVEVTARAKTEAKTGVEMEALTAVTIAALTIYDMCKAVDRGMTINSVKLTFKSGGKCGTYAPK
jgi:cyclic pyranopterin monophosphate synthase